MVCFYTMFTSRMKNYKVFMNALRHKFLFSFPSVQVQQHPFENICSWFLLYHRQRQQSMVSGYTAVSNLVIRRKLQMHLIYIKTNNSLLNRDIINIMYECWWWWGSLPSWFCSTALLFHKLHFYCIFSP